MNTISNQKGVNNQFNGFIQNNNPGNFGNNYLTQQNKIEGNLPFFNNKNTGNNLRGNFNGNNINNNFVFKQINPNSIPNTNPVTELNQNYINQKQGNV